MRDNGSVHNPTYLGFRLKGTVYMTLESNQYKYILLIGPWGLVCIR